jgi:tRNA A-37 threonylcarbamoyl transferase component Bud32/tetratricopeptide (TPR) repeat protein/TolB-like protein
VLERLRAALKGRYDVEREIGAGGMATVFLATDVKHHRAVAIKVLRPELAASIGPDRFLREIEIAAKLQHPHILPVYDSGETDGILYYVMPFVRGESLRDRLLRDGALPAPAAALIAREVADALAYAHTEGIVHRDIKPANILLSQGHAVVADFGIARAVSASATSAGGSLTQAGMAIGTPAYMSPEQALGDASLDGRTDVYALGILLYEMLTGRPPYSGATPQSIIGQALSGTVPKLEHDTHGLQPLVEWTLEREPANRPTAAELTAELDRLITGTGISAARRRRTRPLVIGGVVALAVLAGVVLWSRGAGAAGDPRKSLIVFPFENRTGDASREYLGEAAMNLLGLAAAHWQDMRVFDDERTASLIRRRQGGGGAQGDPIDFEDAREMAREARVGTMVLGDLRREGDSLAIEAKVHDVRSGERLETVILRAGWTADPRPLFDALAARILGTSGAPPGERPSVLAQTTKSIAAYRAYLAGTGALQRFQIDSARRMLERAVELDSTFALAYIRLRDVDGWSGAGGNAARRRQYIAAAERHAATLPPRLRSLVDYHSAYGDDDFQRARAIAQAMIQRDPTDVEAWYQLGEAHYHHRSFDFPHADSLGNMGKALRAFQRTLALDSTYVLAYQHILDALTACGGNPFQVCTGDSSIYGQPAELTRRLGEPAIQRLRAEARAAQIATARGWLTAVPGTPRPRQALVSVLYQQRRYDEALHETESMDRLGWKADAAFLKGSILFQLGRAGEAAAAIHDGLAVSTDTLGPFFSGFGNFAVPSALLAGAGGRWRESLRLNAAIYKAIPVDSANGPGNIRMSRQDLGRMSEWFLAIEVGRRTPGPGASGDGAAEFRALVERLARGDSAALRRISQALGASAVSIFMATRDTVLLSQLVTRADTMGSATWRVADAQLALARGDSARARLRVDRHVRTPADGEFNGEQGVVRAFAWADLLARLRLPREAIAVYARMDSVGERIIHPGLLVRSWAERGALHQALGETAEAIRWYERFIAAWEHADPELQREVDRARDALAALKGEPRRPPGVER